MQQDKNATHWVLGGALLLIGLFVIIALVLVRSQSLTPIAQVNINNLPPIIDNIKLCPSTTAVGTCTELPVDLTAADVDGNSVILTVSDLNGTSDISTVETEFYNLTVKSQGGVDDNNDHYTPTCSLLNTITATSAYYRCPMSMEYFADATGAWTVYAKVIDASDASVSSTEGNKIINVLTNATFETDVNFGTKALGFTTGTADELQIGHYNQGNATNAYFNIQAASDLNCSTLGSIPVGNVKFNATVGAGYANAVYILATTPIIPFVNQNIPQRTNDTIASQDSVGGFASSFWSITVPGNGVSGICTTTVTAIAQVQ